MLRSCATLKLADLSTLRVRSCPSCLLGCIQQAFIQTSDRDIAGEGLAFRLAGRPHSSYFGHRNPNSSPLLRNAPSPSPCVDVPLNPKAAAVPEAFGPKLPGPVPDSGNLEPSVQGSPGPLLDVSLDRFSFA